MSLLIQSSPEEEPPSLDIMPGTTRGILKVLSVRFMRCDKLRIVSSGGVGVEVKGGVMCSIYARYVILVNEFLECG
jgi:hypothetical protein